MKSSKFDNKLATELGLNAKEISILKKLNSPIKIQDYLQNMPANLEKVEETLMSPRLTLKSGICHCLEGALLAALALWLHGHKPLLVDMKGKRGDFDHVICVFRINDYWGAISKTNHSVIRYRDPIYRDIRELVISYFHEYTKDGIKTLYSYSELLDLSKIDKSWVIAEKNLWYIDKLLNKSNHFNIVPNKKTRLRKSDPIEIDAGDLVEYK